ncbi:MAG: glycerophosphodiester phosphodiesterase family protein [Prolixibacteraceae bacterium]|jgi:glycerophosphoryl diester phosphodiesterase
MRRLKFLLASIALILVSGSSLFAQVANFKSPLPKPRQGGVYVIAHRGAHNGIPENSLAAYQKAINLGCDFVEIDVRTTKDGKFVSMHNSTIDEYVDGKKGKVNDFTLAELRSMDIGSRVGPQWEKTKVPTFEEILNLCKGKIGIYLDLKNAYVPDLIKIIKQYRMEKDIVWYISASDMKQIMQVVDNCPDCIPMPDAGPAKNIDTVAKKITLKVLATDMGELNQNFVETAHNHHALVFTDEKAGTETEWNQILKWKTDGIQTNHPAELIEYLEKHGK